MIRALHNDDFEAYERFLKPFTATSMFLRSNALKAGLDYQGQDYQGEYLGSFDASGDTGDINGVLVHYWNSNIMMQAASIEVLQNLIEVFKDNVSRPVGGILGQDSQVQAVIDGLGLSDAQYATDYNEELYELDLENLIIPDHIEEHRYSIISAGVSVGVSTGQQVGKQILKQWIKDYELETRTVGDADNHDAHVEERVERTIKDGDCWVLFVDGQPVSLSGFNARLPDVVQIGPVWTPIESRNKGYARLLVALTLEKARNEGIQKSVLFTDTPAGAKAYKAIGFREVGSYRLALLKNRAVLTQNTQIRM